MILPPRQVEAAWTGPGNFNSRLRLEQLLGSNVGSVDFLLTSPFHHSSEGTSTTQIPVAFLLIQALVIQHVKVWVGDSIPIQEIQSVDKVKDIFRKDRANLFCRLSSLCTLCMKTWHAAMY